MSYAIVSDTQICHNRSIRERYAEAIRRCGNAKAIARAIDCSHRTVQRWLAGDALPQAEEIAALGREFEEFKRELIAMMDAGAHAHNIVTVDRRTGSGDRRSGVVDRRQV